VVWSLGLGVAGGLLVGAVLTLFLLRARGTGRRGPDGRGTGPDGEPSGIAAARDPRGGLARKSLDSLRVGVVVLDPDGEPVMVNPSARAMGLLRAGPRPGTMAAHPIVRTLAGQVRRSGVRREVDLDLPRGGGQGGAEPLGVLLRAVGVGGGYVAVEAADATEAHRVARMRRDFIANVGHELKTPIGALQLLSEALLDATGTGEPTAGKTEPAAGKTDPAADVAAARRFAERIHHESTRLGKLISELLELSRLQGAEPLPVPDPVSVDAVIAEVLDRTRTGAAAKDIQIDLVEPDEGLVVYGSDAQLTTAVANLVDNAVAYSPEGSRVVLSCRRAGDYVEISVADRGIGIASVELDRIFERFYRSDQARSRATGGTGLGLAIVKHIATNHGGRVDVTSQVGEGSTFTLRLPARPPADVRRSPGSAGTGSRPGNGSRPAAGAPAAPGTGPAPAGPAAAAHPAPPRNPADGQP